MGKEGEEIDIRDYFKTISRYKRLIIFVCLAAALAGAVYGLLEQKEYVVSSVLEIGRIQDTPVEDPAKIKARVDNGKYASQIIAKSGIPAAKQPFILTEVTDGSLLSLKITSPGEEEAKKILEAQTDLILAEQQKKIGEQLNVMKNNVSYIEKTIARNSNYEKIFTERIFALNTENKFFLEEMQKIAAGDWQSGYLEKQIFIFEMQKSLGQNKETIEDYYSKIDDRRRRSELLENNKKLFEDQISGIEKTELVQPVQVSAKPGNKGPLVYSAIGAVAGLLFSIFLSLMIEYVFFPPRREQRL